MVAGIHTPSPFGLYHITYLINTDSAIFPFQVSMTALINKPSKRAKSTAHGSFFKYIENRHSLLLVVSSVENFPVLILDVSAPLIPAVMDSPQMGSSQAETSWVFWNGGYQSRAVCHQRFTREPGTAKKARVHRSSASLGRNPQWEPRRGVQCCWLLRDLAFWIMWKSKTCCVVLFYCKGVSFLDQIVLEGEVCQDAHCKTLDLFLDFHVFLAWRVVGWPSIPASYWGRDFNNEKLKVSRIKAETVWQEG